MHPRSSSHLPSIPRIDDIDLFLSSQNLKNDTLTFLAGDASFRTYYRINDANGTSLVLMDAPPPEDPRPFIEISNFLQSKGFSAPRIIAEDLEKGFVLLEDFGDKTYTKILNAAERLDTESPSLRSGSQDDTILSCHTETLEEGTQYLENTQEQLYFLAVDTLIDLHKKVTVKPPFLKEYTPEVHLREASVLMEWAYPALWGKQADEAMMQEYRQLWIPLLTQAAQTAPQSIVLRDYHVDNLMLLADRPGIAQCGLLDFQDALWGSVTYDLVSLLEDARRDIPKDLIDACWVRYSLGLPGSDIKALQHQALILSAARHAKIIGIFTRLAVRDNKPHYLEHIPRVWRLLQRCLSNPALSDLNHWFAIHFPLEIRGATHD